MFIKHFKMQMGDNLLTSQIKLLLMTTNQQFMYIRFFLELMEPHNQVYLQLYKQAFYFAYFLIGFGVFIVFYYILIIHSSYLQYLIIFLAVFQYVYIIQNQIILYVHQHLLKHYQALNPCEYISFYGLNPKL